MMRILPWITDGAVGFLDGYLFANIKAGSKFKVFEFGTGNSTLYFLSRGCWVTGVDHDEKWVKSVRGSAEAFDYSARLTISACPRPYHTLYLKDDYRIIAIDGMDRVACLRHVLTRGLPENCLLLLDNTERVRGSGPGKGPYANYMNLLQGFQMIHFEQPTVRGQAPAVGNYHDRSGHRVKHRWITTIAWSGNMGPFTTSGAEF